MKKTSLKSQKSGSVSSGNGRRSTPGDVVSMISALMPLCFGDVGIGAHEAQAPVGVLRARRPHLLAVDDELVAVELGAGREAREVAARAGLAHAEAPRDLGPQRRQRGSAPSARRCRSRGSTGR